MTGYDKLVRDRIPEIIIGNGGTCRTETVAGEDLFGYLDRKLDEETEEFRESRDPEELADVMEVFSTIRMNARASSPSSSDLSVSRSPIFLRYPM